MPRGWFPHALTNYTPLLTSAPTPGISSATESPTICVRMSAALVPYIVGALELYRWRDKWQGSSAQVATALGVMQDLIDILITGDNCGGDVTEFRFTSDCGLEYTNNAGESWTPVPGWTEFASICFQGPTGPQGPTGLPGADGQPVELRVYFGTIQWRVVGTEVWNHLINLSEITGPAGADGADGPPIELRVYFGTIQWRVVGTSVWNHLINLDEICECEDTDITNPNPLTDGLLCAISFRVASEIRRVWDYAFTNPNNVISDLAAGVGTFAGLFALLWPGVGWTATATISGFVSFISQVFGASETNSFTLATENYLAGLIYCELSHRQQREITTDLLNDVIPHLHGAPDLTDKQKLALMAFIVGAPLQAWALAAYATAPYPDGSACSAITCPDENDYFWCVQLFEPDAISDVALNQHPLIQSMLIIERGLLVESVPVGYGGTANYGYPFLPDILDQHPQRELRLRITFPRPTRIDRLQFEVFFNQTAAPAVGNVLKVVSDDGTVLINETTTGVSGSTQVEIFEWWGDKEVKSLTITGQVWASALWTDLAAQLRLTSFKIQGRDYNPFKPLTNCIWDAPPNAPTPPAHDWTATFSFWLDDYDFTTELRGTTIPAQSGQYIAGYGWKSTYNASGGLEAIELRLTKSLPSTFNGVVAIRTLSSRAHINGASRYIYLGAGGGGAYWNFPRVSQPMSYEMVTGGGGLGNRITYVDSVGGENTSGIDWNGTEGYVVLHQIKLYGTGTRPSAFDGIPD